MRIINEMGKESITLQKYTGLPSQTQDVASGKPLQKMEDHKHYVQGVAWDPLHKYLASQSADRSCRIYKHHKVAKGNKQPQRYCCNLLTHKHSSVPVAQEADGSTPTESLNKQRLFLDESTSS